MRGAGQQQLQVAFNTQKKIIVKKTIYKLGTHLKLYSESEIKNPYLINYYFVFGIRY